MGNFNTENKKITVKKLIFDNILNIEFLLSFVIPVILFTVFGNFNMELTGIILAGLWSIGLVMIQIIIYKKANVFAIIATCFSAVGLIGTVISKDPMFYLASPIILDILLALVFFGSIIIGKPLIQILAENTVKGGFPEEIRNKANYKSAWIILTNAWGILSITQALLRIVLIYTASKEVYFAISTAYGNISSPLMLVFSFWFPKWYWKRNNPHT